MRRFRRDHIWLKMFEFYRDLSIRFKNIDISQYKGYFSAQVSPQYGNKELPTRHFFGYHMFEFISKFDFTQFYE